MNAEEKKNKKRIEDLVRNYGHDKDSMIYIASLQANKITKPEKAFTRGKKALAMGHDDLYKVFYERYMELQPRKDKISNLLDHLDNDSK